MAASILVCRLTTRKSSHFFCSPGRLGALPYVLGGLVLRGGCIKLGDPSGKARLGGKGPKGVTYLAEARLPHQAMYRYGTSLGVKLPKLSMRSRRFAYPALAALAETTRKQSKMFQLRTSSATSAKESVFNEVNMPQILISQEGRN